MPICPGVKRPGRDVQPSPQSSDDVTIMWSYTSATPYVSMMWCLIKHSANLKYLYFKGRRCKVVDWINMAMSSCEYGNEHLVSIKRDELVS